MITKAWIVCMVILGVVCLWVNPARTQEKKDGPKPEQTAAAEDLSRLFSLDVPEEFKSQATEEPGILKWKKDAAEICLVVSEVFAGSADQLFQALRTAGEEKGEMDEVKDLDLKGLKAAMFKEKPAKEPERLRVWRLIAIAKTKMFCLELSAPEREFPALTAEFDKVAASFKVKEQ
ncbi:MAG: hypothetical protein AB1646_18760 [Thermodesulfobacteriota bacterium]